VIFTKIGIGDTVFVKDDFGIHSFRLISSDSRSNHPEEGDMSITDKSPLGEALIGKTKGEKVTVGINAIIYSIIAIEKNKNITSTHTLNIRNSWIILSNDCLVFMGSENDVKDLYKLLNESQPNTFIMKYIERGNFSKHDKLYGSLLNITSSIKKEMENEVCVNAISKYKPRTLKLSNNSIRKQPSTNPSNKIVNNLLKKSKSDRFDEACAEFIFEGDLVEEGESLYSGKCELCEKDMSNVQYMIFNSNSPENNLLVGPICIIRFLKLNYANTHEESFDIINRLAALGYLAKHLVNYVIYLGDEVINESTILSIMEILEKHHGPNNRLSQEDIDIVIKRMNMDPIITYRFRLIAEGNFSLLKTQIKIKTMKNEKEGQYWGKLRSRVDMSLSRSEAYKSLM
jgi:hypothetical protein